MLNIWRIFGDAGIWQAILIIAGAVLVCLALWRLILRFRRLPKELVDLAGFAYDRQQGIFYSKMDAWQRRFGYCELYDKVSPMLDMIFDCEPVRFRYKGKTWLIEFWKGQYGMTTGAEVGIYYTSKKLPEDPNKYGNMFFRAVKDKDMLPISIKLSKGDQVLFMRSQKHWWLTGFVLGEFSWPEELTLQVGICFIDTEMRDAFIGALEKAGYKEGRMYVEDNAVWVFFDKPFTSPPSTRTAGHDSLVQKQNKVLCDSYNALTAGIDDPMEKLLCCEKNDPELYSQAINFHITPGISRAKRLIRGENHE